LAAASKEPARYGRESDALTATELQLAHVATTADGVRQLRPSVLQSTRTIARVRIVVAPPSVFLNGT
jgi:hypothetical protein